MVNLLRLLLHALPAFARQGGGLDDKSVLSRRDWELPDVDDYRARAFHSGKTPNGPHVKILASPSHLF